MWCASDHSNISTKCYNMVFYTDISFWLFNEIDFLISTSACIIGYSEQWFPPHYKQLQENGCVHYAQIMNNEYLILKNR